MSCKCGYKTIYQVRISIQRGNIMSIRQAAVAGQFYQAGKKQLQAQINQLMAAGKAQTQVKPEALIVPHAGYIYSGETAALAYQSLQSRRHEIKRVILFGPAHRVYLAGMALPSVDTFNTPLGEIPLDRETIDRIATLPGVIVSDEAHRLEHSLEVQLPFLQAVLDDFSLIPVVVGDCDAYKVAGLMDRLWGGNDSLMVISSDLSHFHTYNSAKQIDASTCQRILDKSSDLTGEEACGARALNGLMRSEHVQSLNIELLAACNSGDTAGDKNRVVGYGAFILH